MNNSEIVTVDITAAHNQESNRGTFELSSDYLLQYRIDASQAINVTLDFEDDSIHIEWKDTEKGLRTTKKVDENGELMDRLIADYRQVILPLIALNSGYHKH